MTVSLRTPWRLGSALNDGRAENGEIGHVSGRALARPGRISSARMNIECQASSV